MSSLAGIAVIILVESTNQCIMHLSVITSKFSPFKHIKKGKICLFSKESPTREDLSVFYPVYQIYNYAIGFLIDFRMEERFCDFRDLL